MTIHEALQTLFAGLAVASVHYWILTVKPKNRGKEDFKWWLYTIVPQAILLSVAAKLLHWF